MSLRLFLILATMLAIFLPAVAQTKDANAPAAKPAAANSPEKSSSKTARAIEAERLLKEKRANAQSLLISLAADARSFNDMVTRGRTLARIASVLWTADRERARAMFYLAWDAAEVADKESFERSKSETRVEKSGPGLPYTVSPEVRNEVIRLAARREGALAEDFIAKMKEQMRRENGGALISTRTALGGFDPFIKQRLDVARQLLEADEIERALVERDARKASGPEGRS